MRLLRSILILSAAAFLLPVLAPGEAQAEGTGGETPAESAAAVLSDSDYQSQLPNLPPPPEEGSSSSSNSGSHRIELPPIEIRRDSEPRSIDQGWLWAAAGLAGALLAAYLLFIFYRARRGPVSGDSAKSRRRPSKPAQTAAAAAPIDEPTILDQADRLAAAGRYSEAIHFLLLNGLQHVGRKTRQRIPPELTNRELLRALRLAENMAGALSVLVRLSERSHFGGAQPSAADYRLSREKFQLFALHSGGAAS